MTRILGIDDKKIKQRLAVTDEEIKALFVQKMDEINQYILNNYPAQIVDINTYLSKNRRSLRENEVRQICQQRARLEQSVREAREYFRKKEEE